MARNDEDLLKEAKETFEAAQSVESENRARAEEDIRFTRLGEQWDPLALIQRQYSGRPALTINRVNAFFLHVFNEARKNRPSLRVRPVDSKADVETAKVHNDLIRNIEANSAADIAYDTAIGFAIGGGFGYWAIDIDYAYDGTADRDIIIRPIFNPFSIYGDPDAQAPDGSDWNTAIELERIQVGEFEDLYPDAEAVSFQGGDDAFAQQEDGGLDYVEVANFWQRRRAEREVIVLSNGEIVPLEALNDPDYWLELVANGVRPTNQVDTVRGYEVKRHIMNGEGSVESVDWPGSFVPIVPVYGDEQNLFGERSFFGLTHFARDPQQQLNFWTSAATEIVAKAPRTPFIGPERAFSGRDADKWANVSTRDFPYISYKGNQAPRRETMDQQAVGAITQAAAATDSLKAVLGLYDPSLGADGTEISGKAITARQRQGDTATFHFSDNQLRSVRHGGRIVLDLIPHVWTGPRIARLIDEGGEDRLQPVNQPVPVTDDQGQPQMEPDPTRPPIVGRDGQVSQPMRPRMRTYDLTVGKYDLSVSPGPSYGTKRQEASEQILEVIRSFPQMAPILLGLLAKNLDWPGADEIAQRVDAMLPPGLIEGLPPSITKALEGSKQMIQALRQELEETKKSQGLEVAKLKQEGLGEQIENTIKAYAAETDRIEALAKAGVAPSAPFYEPNSILPEIGGLAARRGAGGNPLQRPAITAPRPPTQLPARRPVDPARAREVLRRAGLPG